MLNNLKKNTKRKTMLLLAEENWQRIVNIIAEILNVKVVMINKVERENIKIVKTNDSENNPLNKNKIFRMEGKLCEKVIKNKKILEVNNIEDKKWSVYNKLEFGLKSYFGLPILTPDRSVFGTLCIFDDKERNFNETQKDLLIELKNVIEGQIGNVYYNKLLNLRVNEIEKIKNKYQEIIDNINDPLFIHKKINKQNTGLGNFVEVNKKASQKLGYSKEELLSMSPDDIDGSNFHNSKQKIESIKQIEKNGDYTFEAFHKKKNGDTYPVEINSKIIKYEGEKAILSLARDISERKKIEKELFRQKELTQSSLDSLSAHIAVLDEEGFIRYTNQAWKNFIKENNSSLDKSDVGVNYLQVCKSANGDCSEEAPIAYQGIKEVINKGQKIFSLEYPCHSSNEKRWFKMRVTPFNGKGTYKAVIAHENITERKLKEEELEKMKNKLEKILETANDGFIIIDRNGTILKVNKSLVKMVGYSREELLNMNIFEIDIKENEEKGKEHLKNIIDTGSDYFETTLKTKSGRNIYVEVSTTYIDELETPIFNAFIRDITERKKEEEKIRFLSFCDQLTGVYNRRYFEDTIKRLNRSRKLPIGVLTADIDNLKSINDLYGHHIGDKYIKKVAKTLKNTVRNGDIVSRIGGDEFAVLFPKIDSKDIEKIEERFHKEINKITIENLDFSVSTGIEIKSDYKQDLEDILKISDKKMFKMKNNTKEANLKRKLCIVKNKEKIVFNEMPMGLMISGLDGKIVEVNNKLTKMLGYKPEELKNKTHFEITRDEDSVKNRELSKQLKNNEIDSFELGKKYIKKNGSYIDVHIKVKSIKDNNGEPVYDFAFVKKI